jgi:hypothetical protein
MKRFLTIALCAIMMAMCSISTQAQGKRENRQRIPREELAQKQAKHIAEELAFDDATTERFTQTFCEYQKEVWALGPRHERHQRKDSTEMTDAEVEQAIKARMERSQKLLDLREKYYEKYNEFLTPKQIQRVYQLERQMMRKLSKKPHGQRNPHSGARKEQRFY